MSNTMDDLDIIWEKEIGGYECRLYWVYNALGALRAFVFSDESGEEFDIRELEGYDPSLTMFENIDRAVEHGLILFEGGYIVEYGDAIIGE